MVLRVKAWIYARLTADVTLAALVPIGQIVQAYPEVVGTFPFVGFQEDNQPATVYEDDRPVGFETMITISVFTAKAQQNQADICSAIDNIMFGLFFDLEYSADVPETNAKALHRVLRYRRQITAEDLSN